MGKPKTVDMSVNLEELDALDKKKHQSATRPAKPDVSDTIKSESTPDSEVDGDAKKRKKVDIQAKIEEKIEANKDVAIKKATRSRSKTYISSRRLVDKTKYYPVQKAVALLLKTSYSKFPGTVVADLGTKDGKISITTTFPYSTGKITRVAIASDALLKKIEAGELDFDILLATPDMMPKLAKHARVLGPKGMMPNPKNATVTTEPEKRQKELEGGKTTLKSEKKSPLMHVILGKTNQPDKELIANTQHLIKAVGGKKILKLTLSATMSPGIKVDLSEFQTTV